MAINFNNQNRGIETLDLSEYGLLQPQNQNMQVAGGYDTPTEGQYGFNLIELDRLKNAGYDPAEVSGYENKEDVQSLIRSLEPTAMAISNYEQLFGPRTMTDANQSLYTGMMDQLGTPINYTDRIRQENLPAFANQPKYTIRGQIANDLRDIAAIPGRIKDGVMGSAPVEFIGEQFNKAKDGIMGSSAMDFFRGLPTPGNLLMNIAATRNPLNPRASNYNPTLQGQIDYMKDKGMYGIIDQSGLNKITGGRLAGKNLVSGFGSNDLGEMYSKDLSKLQGYLSTMPQRFSRLRKNNPASYEKKVKNLQNKIKQNKIEAQAAQAAREAATAARARAANPNVYARADALGFTNPGGGFKSVGTNENFSNKTGRGRTGYSEGGLASMFTRRG